MECCLQDRLFDLFFEFCLDIFHEYEIRESFLFVSDLSIDLPSDVSDHHSSDHEIQEYHEYCSSHKADGYEYIVSLKLIEIEIAIVVLELCYRGVHMVGLGIFYESCEYHISFEGGPDRPTGH